MPDDSSAALLLANHPSLNAIQDDDTSADAYSTPCIPIVVEYDYREHKSFIVEKFKSRISATTQHAVLTLDQEGFQGAAARLATCCYFATVYKEGKCKKHAKAHRHSCHFWICAYCGRPENRMHCWARKRYRQVLTTAQTGIEIIGPQGLTIKALHDTAIKLAKLLHLASLRHHVIDPGAKDSRIRMVVPIADLNYSATQQILRSFAGPAYSLQIRRSHPPLAILKWLFAATDAIWGLCGHSRARIFMAYSRQNLVRSSGSFYRICKERENMAEFAEEIEPGEPMPLKLIDMCPCGCGEMVDVPPANRRIRPAEDIEQGYITVDYSGCFDPFKVRRKDNTIPPHTIKSERASMNEAAQGRHGPN